MQVLKIDVTKINKDYLFKTKDKEDGTKGATYLDCAIHENKDGVDQYGNAGFITQSVSKELREKGVKGPIIGNWKNIGSNSAPTPTPPPATRPAATKTASRPAPPPRNDFADDDSVPF